MYLSIRLQSPRSEVCSTPTNIICSVTLTTWCDLFDSQHIVMGYVHVILTECKDQDDRDPLTKIPGK